MTWLLKTKGIEVFVIYKDLNMGQNKTFMEYTSTHDPNAEAFCTKLYIQVQYKVNASVKCFI